MTLPISRSLVPVSNRLPARSQKTVAARAGYSSGAERTGDYDLVRQETYLRDAADVEKFLPDILGRALARIWIDGRFRDQFAANPKETLAEYGVYLPRNITIDFVTEGTPRPMVVVYEQPSHGGPRQKLMYLRLMMMAGR